MKIRLFLSCMLFGALSTCCEGANVLWDVASAWDAGSQAVVEINIDRGERGWITANFSIGFEINGILATLTSNPGGMHFLSDSPGAWIAAETGDNVSSATMFNQPKYFLEDGFAGSTYVPETTVIVMTDIQNYFKFAIQDPDQLHEYWEIFQSGGTPNFIPDTYYGWVEYIVDDQSNLLILKSAIGLDGQPMVVGAIPEPSTTALMLVGLVAVGVCRRRA